MIEVTPTGVNRRAPDLGDLPDVSRAALSSLDFERLDTGFHEIGQQLHGVEAGRFLDGVVGFLVDLETTLAERRVAGALARPEAVDQHTAQPRFHAARRFLVAHRFARRASALAVGRCSGSVGRQGAAPLDHHAQATETKHLDLDRRVLCHVLDLRQRQDTRQHRALDAKALVVEVDRLVVGRRALN